MKINRKNIYNYHISSSRLTLLYLNAQVYYFGEQVLGALKASAPSNIEVVVADAGNIHVLKS